MYMNYFLHNQDYPFQVERKLSDESKEEKITKAANRLKLPKKEVELLIDDQEEKEEHIFKEISVNKNILA